MAREVRCHQTDRRTDGRTDTPTDYSNPRCACAPRVNDDIDKICILPANLLAKITDINSAMFFQDQCNLPDEVNNHTRLQSNHVGKAFECAIREENGAAETVHGNTNFTISRAVPCI